MPDVNDKLYNWYNGEFESIGAHLDCIDWNSFICYHPQAGVAWSAFVDILWMLIDTSIRLCQLVMFRRDGKMQLSLQSINMAQQKCQKTIDRYR